MKPLLLLLSLRNGRSPNVVDIKLTFDEEAIKEMCIQAAHQMIPEAGDGTFEVTFNHTAYVPKFIATWVPKKDATLVETEIL